MKLDHIDTMRGLAILMVVFVHTASCVPDLSNQAIALSGYGQMGVQLFFVASAFTLCHSAIARRGEDLPLISYAIRRYFRIAPMYYIGIVMYCALSVLENWVLHHALKSSAEYTLPNVLANVFFVHGFVPGGANNKIVPGGWSIGTEMAFYAVFPLLFAGFMKLGKLNLRTAALIFAITVLASQAVLWAVYEVTGLAVADLSFMYFNIVNQLPVFVLGMVLFFLVREDRWPIKSKWGNVAGFVAFTAATALAWAAAHPNFSAIPVLAGLSFLFLFKVLEETRALNPVFLRRIGKVSFSMYVLHFFFAYKITRALGKVLVPKIGEGASLAVLFVIAAAGSYLAAVVAHRLVESRFMDMGKQLIVRLRERLQRRKPSVRPTVL